MMLLVLVLVLSVLVVLLARAREREGGVTALSSTVAHSLGPCL